MRVRIPAANLWLLGLSIATAAGPASAALDPAIERQVAGVFSNACDDPGRLRIRLFGDVLAVERAGVAVEAHRVRASRTPPPGPAVPAFKAVVQGEVRGGDGVALLLTHDAQGLFARIDGSERALAPLGSGVLGQRLRHCDPNRNALPGAAAAPAAPQSPSELLGDGRFKRALTQAFGPLMRERWIARLDGPAPPLRQVTVAGASYTLASTCKPHDCALHNLVLLWDPRRERVVGLVQQRGGKTLVGAPEPALASALERLWTQEWRAR